MSATAVDTSPGDLELVRDFVNTRDIERGTDLLLDPEQLATWLREHALGAQADSSVDADRLARLREALRAMLLANNSGDAPPPSALADLNDAAGAAPLALRFDRGGASGLGPVADGTEAAIARILAAVHEAMRDGSWGRLKACPADDCHWAFYDRSRNRSGTWCEMEECGNRAKARAYRERRRSRPPR